MSKKTALQLYALAVCLVAVVCLLITMIVGLYDIVKVAFPHFTLNTGTWGRYATDDAYWRWTRPHCHNDRTTNCDDTAVRPPAEELTKQRNDALANEYAMERRNGEQGLVHAALVTLVSVALFIPHWLLAKRAREQAATAPN